MFYGQCNDCGERWSLGTASTCKCPDLVTWDASAPIVTTPHPAFKQWIGLTDDEIHKIFCYVEYETNHDWNSNPEGWCKAFAKAVDDQLKEKNHA